MAITSNYQMTITPLQSEELGVLPKPKQTQHHSPWLSILGWVATIAEIGVSLLLPETAPVWASLAVSTVGAGVQTGLMAASGEISTVGLTLNWAAALIPFGAQSAKLASKEVKVSKLVDVFNKSASEELKVSKDVVRDWMNSGYLSNAFTEVEKNIGGALDYQTIMEMGRYSEWSVEGRIYDMLRSAEEQAMSWRSFTKTEIEAMEQLGAKEFVIRRAIEQAEEFERDVVESIRQSISNLINNPAAETIVGEVGEELSQQFTGADAREIRTLLTKVFGKEVDELYELLKVTPKHAHQSVIKGWILEKLGQKNANELLERIYDIYDKPKRAARLARQSVKNNSAFAAAMRKAGSKNFDEKVVQRVQAIFDASDFGRKWIEDSYKILKKKLRKAFARTGKALDKLEELEEAYVKSGGHLVAGSEIIGYKVLKTVGHKSLIMINFNPAKWDMGGTAAKNMIWKGRMTKNYGGKKPVFVWARVDEMARLVAEGMEYYLEKFAYSRGGTVVGTSLFGNIFKGMDVTVLPFINTGVLRNLLSLTSNIVENSYDMAHGTWHKEWVDKAWRSFKRTGVSRFGRLFAQGIVRPVIGGRVGYYVGREVQRLLGATSTAVNNNILEHKSTFAKQWMQSYKQKFMGGAVSYLNAPARQRGRYAAQKRTAQRKLGFLRRPVSAITPDAILSPRKIGIIKL